MGIFSALLGTSPSARLIQINFVQVSFWLGARGEVRYVPIALRRGSIFTNQSIAINISQFTGTITLPCVPTLFRRQPVNQILLTLMPRSDHALLLTHPQQLVHHMHTILTGLLTVKRKRIVGQLGGLERC